MTTKLFKDLATQLGYRVTEGKYAIKIESESRCHLASAHIKSQYSFTTNPDVAIKQSLFDLLVEYAETPVEQRKNETYYRLSPIGYLYPANYLHYCPKYDQYFIDFLGPKDGIYQTQFTKEQIKEMPTWCQELYWGEV